ncbi:hypothetical protein Syun_025352 [Stephania yunnanensis]|uniref:Helicase associated domain-containing protein n=1 Tax=Stephania yunnanensis TaxID=152371 RepID=A0AAP0HUT6_9MAGN
MQDRLARMEALLMQHLGIRPYVPPTSRSLPSPALGKDNILGFDWLASLAPEAMIRALEVLYALGVLDEDAKLTSPIGFQVSKIPLPMELVIDLLFDDGIESNDANVEGEERDEAVGTDNVDDDGYFLTCRIRSQVLKILRDRAIKEQSKSNRMGITRGKFKASAKKNKKNKSSQQVMDIDEDQPSVEIP